MTRLVGCEDCGAFGSERICAACLATRMRTITSDHFESLLRASKKAQAEILARVRAEPSCEELEARRAIAGGGS